MVAPGLNNPQEALDEEAPTCLLQLRRKPRPVPARCRTGFPCATAVR